MATLGAVQVGFGTWERQHEIDLAKDPLLTSHADGEVKLAAFQTKRNKFSADLKAAYLSLAAAWQLDNDKSLAAALAFAIVVRADIDAMGFKL
jgi:hypothetical protein